LTLVHDEAHHFKKEHLSLLSAIAGQAAIALENARLFKQTEQERSKLSAIINSTQDAVLVTTPRNEVMLLNPAAQEMIDVNGDWQNRPISELTDNADLLKLLSPDAPTTGEICLPDGRTMWANVTQIPDMDKVTVLRDISPYKELDRMKRSFVVAFTHDLRTPLATVKGYLDLVRMDGPITELQDEDLIGIAKATHSMKSMVEDLLELSRLEQLEQLTDDVVDLEDVVQSSLNYMRPAAKSKRIDLVAGQIATDLFTEGNSVLLIRAISNFLDNAIKYTPRQGKVHIQLIKNNNQAHVSVTDNGPGISAKDLPRVFEKFFRARAEIDEDVPGTGLGLSIVKTIIEHHNGQIWVESVPNEGSTFTLALPLIEVEHG
jgi:signal transduction histidine kinase